MEILYASFDSMMFIINMKETDKQLDGNINCILPKYIFSTSITYTLI